MGTTTWKEVTLYLLCRYERHDEREGNDGPGSCRPAWEGTVVYAVDENPKVIDRYIKDKDGTWSGCSKKSIQVLKKDGAYYQLPEEAVAAVNDHDQAGIRWKFAGILCSQQMASERAEALAACKAKQTAPRGASQ